MRRSLARSNAAPGAPNPRIRIRLSTLRPVAAKLEPLTQARPFIRGPRRINQARMPRPPQDTDPPDIEDFEPLAETDEEPSLTALELEGGEAAPASVERGAAAIRAHWKHAPVGPGVYRMIAEDGE